jgi:hypothetical protein
MGRNAGWALLGACALALCLGACGGQERTPSTGSVAAGGSERIRIPGLSFAVPEGWQSQEPQTSMRLAEYTVPGPGGEASLVIYRFPGGGSAQANVERWIGQFQGASGADARASAQVQSSQRDGLTLTSLDVSGSYEGQQMPGAPAQPGIANARLLALVVEGSDDPYFFKLLGPAETVSQWAPAWAELTGSVTQE